MPKQNFVATAAYFARRARTATSEARRLQLEAAAQHYRIKAKGRGEKVDGAGEVPSSAGPEWSRRDKLAELFRAFETQRR